MRSNVGKLLKRNNRRFV